MKKIFSTLFVAAIALIAASCGGSNTPSAISESIYSQMQKGNYEKAVQILVDNLDSEKAPTAEEKAQFVTAFTAKAKQSSDAKGGVKSFEIVKEEIAEDGNSATVEIKVVYGDGSEKTEHDKYVKKDGKWKFSLGK